ncbi:hypothetical protein D3C87_1648810 [compost metagenome]
MVFGDHRQRQVDTGSDAAGRDEVTVQHVDLVGLYPRLGKALDQSFGVVPMGGDAVAVEQPGMPQHEGAGADRTIPACAADSAVQPAKQRRMFFVIGPGTARHQ